MEISGNNFHNLIIWHVITYSLFTLSLLSEFQRLYLFFAFRESKIITSSSCSQILHNSTKFCVRQKTSHLFILPMQKVIHLSKPLCHPSQHLVTPFLRGNTRCPQCEEITVELNCSTVEALCFVLHSLSNSFKYQFGLLAAADYWAVAFVETSSNLLKPHCWIAMNLFLPPLHRFVLTSITLCFCHQKHEILLQLLAVSSQFEYPQ